MPIDPPGDFSDIPLTQRPITIIEGLADFDRELRLGNMAQIRPIPLGFPQLDKNMGGGMHMEDLWLLGGMQNVGKTIMALQVARNIAIASDALPIVVCYEHGKEILLMRLLCLESLENREDPEGNGVRLSEIERVIAEYSDHISAEENKRPLNFDWLVERLPNLQGAYQRMAEYANRLWLVKGDPVHTTVDVLHRYVQMANALGHRRVVLIVDYIQRMPFFSMGGIDLSPTQQIDFLVRGLKGIGLDRRVPVLGVAAADSESLRQQRVHIENLWGPSTMQYEPDGAFIINRDTMNADGTNKIVRIGIEKNRWGPSEIEFRHYLHGAYYSLSNTGRIVSEDESYQAERINLKRTRIGPDPLVALAMMYALRTLSQNPKWANSSNGHEHFVDLWRQMSISDNGGRDILEKLIDMFDLEDRVK